MKPHVFQITVLTVALFTMCVARGIAEEPAAAPEGTFSFVVLPDTQGYVSEKNEAYFEAEVNWILDNRKTQRIVFVSHVGDIVDKYKSDEEWQIARKHMLRLSGKLPFAFSVGNHDMLSGGDSQKFQETFPASLFENEEWYGGQIKNNADSYQLISVGGMDFVILHLECNAPDDVLEWANGVLEKHADRRAMVTTHMYLGPRDRPRESRDYYDATKGRMRWHKTQGKQGNTPQQMWEKCFSKHENLFLICCGDQSRTQAMHRTVKGEHGNPVHECLSDYRGGFLRIYRFEPKQNQISVMTYSPLQQELCSGTKIAPDVDDHQFVLKYEMSK
ncbi:Calcineurin-like phosphoesterase [Symmachiella dynata]|uniref:metallophosphoesterase n=1 Tax=Symmachiella dynata TaxID=2527995 RepID=UPI001187B860|nr:metallophosphoesterase [Symmachiella dynata]QDT49100.1 Calcineurin-like phosphoesterase [Symmachiella dynata]